MTNPFMFTDEQMKILRQGISERGHSGLIITDVDFLTALLNRLECAELLIQAGRDQESSTGFITKAYDAWLLSRGIK